jgi:hypothetical protein
MKQIINNISKELLPFVKFNLVIEALDKLISYFITLILFIIGGWLLFKVVFQIQMIFRLY